jgi:hypothetical protein
MPNRHEPIVIFAGAAVPGEEEGKGRVYALSNHWYDHSFEVLDLSRHPHKWEPLPLPPSAKSLGSNIRSSVSRWSTAAPPSAYQQIRAVAPTASTRGATNGGRPATGCYPSILWPSRPHVPELPRHLARLQVLPGPQVALCLVGPLGHERRRCTLPGTRTGAAARLGGLQAAS